MNASQKGSYTPEEQQHSANSRCKRVLRISRAQVFSPTRPEKLQSSCVFPLSRAAEAVPIQSATFEASPSSFIQKKATGTLLETTFPCFSSKILLNFPISSMLSSRSLIMRCLRHNLRTITFGISLSCMKKVSHFQERPYFQLNLLFPFTSIL